MENENPFLSLPDKDENPFLSMSDEDKNNSSSKDEALRKQRELESHDIVGLPMRKLGHAGGMVLQDIVSLLPKAISAATKLPSELMGEALNVAYDRPRLGRQALGAVGTVLNQTATLPPEVFYYLSRIGLLPESFKKMPVADYSEEIQNFVGKKQPGDALALNLPSIMSALLGVKKLARSGARGINASDGILQKNLREAQQLEQDAISRSKQTAGKADPDLMQYGITNKKEKLNELNLSLDDLNKRIEQVEVPPEVKGDNVHLENAFNLNQAKEEAASQIPHAEALHENAKHEQSNIENKMGEHLNTGATHDVRLARAIKPDLEKLKEHGSNLFDEVEKDVADKGIVLKESRSAKEIAKDYAALFAKEKGDVSKTESGKKLINELNNIGKQEIISASNFISAIKAVKGYLREANQKAYEPLINEDKRNYWLNQASEAKSKLEEMNNILEKNIGEKDFDKLKEANNYWRENIIPLWSEPTYWKIMEGEKITEGNLSSHFRGGKKGSAIEIIRNIIKNNPQALKHMVGERFDKNIKNVISPNEELKQYIDAMPELQNIINKHKEASDTVNRADITSQKAKFHHGVMEHKANEANKIAKEKQDELESMNKLREEKISEKERLANEKENKSAQRKKIIDELKVHQENMENLRLQKEKVKDAKEKERINKEIAKEMSTVKNKVSLWKRTDKLTKTLFFGDYGYHSIKKVIKLLSGNRD